MVAWQFDSATSSNAIMQSLKKHTMYKFYRQLANGAWKYTEPFNSTLDPNYHDLVNYCRENGIKWKLVDSYGEIKFQG